MLIFPCEHCREKEAVLADYRGLDFISKYHLSADCAQMPDGGFSLSGPNITMSNDM
jgi:hypothetical protein